MEPGPEEYDVGAQSPADHTANDPFLGLINSHTSASQLQAELVSSIDWTTYSPDLGVPMHKSSVPCRDPRSANVFHSIWVREGSVSVGGVACSIARVVVDCCTLSDPSIPITVRNLWMLGDEESTVGFHMARILSNGTKCWLRSIPPQGWTHTERVFRLCDEVFDFVPFGPPLRTTHPCDSHGSHDATKLDGSISLPGRVSAPGSQITIHLDSGEPVGPIYFVGQPTQVASIVSTGVETGKCLLDLVRDGCRLVAPRSSNPASALYSQGRFIPDDLQEALFRRLGAPALGDAHIQRLRIPKI